MNIAILNGNPSPENQDFDHYLHRLAAMWSSEGHLVTNLELRSMNLAYCIGCFGCWLKSPGECRSKDDSHIVRYAMIHSNLTLMASPLIMGFPSALLKKIVDKMIPLVHPYIIFDQGEMHHMARYDHYPVWGLLLEKSSNTDEEDICIVTDIFKRTALNGKSRLAFTHSTDDPIQEVAHEIDRL